MKFAINAAGKARGQTSPNPMVGAVIVKDGRMLSYGYHKKAGLPHAEIEAIDSCPDKKMLEGAKMYVSLEPCSFHGKTPPCTDSIIKYGFKEVIVACLDPNPRVNGEGIKKLTDAKINVSYGLMSDAASKQNEVFFKHIKTNMPFIAIKIAASIDGKTAAKTKDSKWITSSKSREKVQQLRYSYDCIITGINTVLADNPLLYPRKNPDSLAFFKHKKKFFRVILDSNLKIKEDLKIIDTADSIKTIIFIRNSIKKEPAVIEKIENLKNKNIIVMPVGEEKAACQGNYYCGLDLNEIFKILANRFEITSVLAECGQTLASGLLKNSLVDKFYIFIAPKIIGSDSPYGMFDCLNVLKVSDSTVINFDSIEKTGSDIFVTAYPALKSMPGVNIKN